MGSFCFSPDLVASVGGEIGFDSSFMSEAASADLTELESSPPKSKSFSISNRICLLSLMGMDLGI